MLIYHYTSFATFIDYILPEKRLKFGVFHGVNDIKETHSNAVVNTLAYPRECDDYDLFNRIEKEYYNHKFISFCTGDDGYKIMSMWAHYGEMNKGVCIEIDTDKLNKSEYTYRGKINYVKEHGKTLYDYITYAADFTNGVLEDKIEAHIKDCKKQFFFEKLKYWSYEKEYRLIKKSDTDAYLDISSAITRVFCGVDMNWMRYDIIYLLTQNSIKLKYSRKEVKELEHWEAYTKSGNQRVNELIDGKNSRNLRFRDRSISQGDYFKKLIPRYDEIFTPEYSSKTLDQIDVWKK